jgi:alpha-galactosidase
MRNEQQFVMIKNLHDQTIAVGLFNRGQEPAEVSIDFSEAGMKGKQMVRDVWRQKDLGRYKQAFSAEVPAQGVVLVRIGDR